MKPSRPTGEMTFLFTDIVGSTELLQSLGESFCGFSGRAFRADRRSVVDLHAATG